MTAVTDVLARAREVAPQLARFPGEMRDRGLESMARALEDSRARLLQANSLDIERARAAGTSAALLDRLMLNEKRIELMGKGLRQLMLEPDPVGEVVRGWRRPNGLSVEQVRTPLGVVAVIYEARPNVTSDVAGLCLKSANACVLRGSSSAAETNLAVVSVLREGLAREGLPEDAVQLIPGEDRADSLALMRAEGMIDLLVPRGGRGLIETVKREARVPVIIDGDGICHVYVDASADEGMATEIVLNAKTQRPTVCNACETLLVHEGIAPRWLVPALGALVAKGVEVRGCPRTRELFPRALPATEKDWATEYLDLVLAVRVVSGLEEALAHIARWGTSNAEAIVTSDLDAARRFVAEVDSGSVFVNASTRFSDGGELGLGAEIGISTQKLHARGPMGLEALTSVKYAVWGTGQVRG